MRGSSLRHRILLLQLTGFNLFAHGDVLLPTLHAVKGFGQVVTASVTMDATTLKSKGFGFVQFKTEDGMKKAIETLNGKKVYYSNFGIRLWRINVA
jgi:hypothetical protein